MSVPTYDQFIEPILRYLAATPEGATARDAHEAAADALNLSEAQRQELITSGQATYKNRAGWAHDRLKRAGLSSSAKRGYWKLTDAGITYAAQHPAPLTADKVEQLAIGFMDVKLKSPTDAIPSMGRNRLYRRSAQPRLARTIAYVSYARQRLQTLTSCKSAQTALKSSCWMCCTGLVTALAETIYSVLAAAATGGSTG